MALYEIDDRQLATILGSLRATQNVQQHEALAPEIADLMTNSGAFTALDDGEVDALCETLNLGALSVSSASEAIKKLSDEPGHQAYRDAVQTEDGVLERDDLAVVSISDDDGAYVQTWTWVPDEAAGIDRDQA